MELEERMEKHRRTDFISMVELWCDEIVDVIFAPRYSAAKTKIETDHVA
jgi:hypothetical protein